MVGSDLLSLGKATSPSGPQIWDRTIQIHLYASHHSYFYPVTISGFFCAFSKKLRRRKNLRVSGGKTQCSGGFHPYMSGGMMSYFSATFTIASLLNNHHALCVRHEILIVDTSHSYAWKDSWLSHHFSCLSRHKWIIQTWSRGWP